MCHRKVWSIFYGTIERLVYWTSVSTTHSPFCFGGCCHIYTHQIRLENLYHLSREFLKCRQRYVISWSKGSVHFVRNPSWLDESSEGSTHFVRNPTRFHGSSKSLVQFVRKPWKDLYGTYMSTTHSPFCSGDVTIYILLRFNWKINIIWAGFPEWAILDIYRYTLDNYFSIIDIPVGNNFW